MAKGPGEGPEEKGPKELREIKEKSVDIKKDAIEIKKKSEVIEKKPKVDIKETQDIKGRSDDIIKSSERINEISKKMGKKIKPELWPMGGWTKWAIAIYFVVLVVFISYFLLATWPVSGTEDDPGKVEYFFGRITLYMPMEARLILLVILAGALGSCIHLGTSFVLFLGKGELTQSFAGWYILRPFIGASLAALFYFAFRGVLFTATPSDFNLYGVVAIAGLAGMFSKQATEKLREVFDKIFLPVQDIEKEKKVGEAEKLREIIREELTRLTGATGKEEESGSVPPERETEEGEEG